MLWGGVLLACLVLRAEAAPVRVITFNIHHAEGDDKKVDLDRIARVALSVQPDVVCLQEVDRNLPRTAHLDFPAVLAEKLGMRGIFEANYRFEGGEYGNAVFTKLEVTAWKNHPLPGPAGIEPRGCLQVDLRLGDKALTVLNTHLGLKAPEREQQVAAILGFLPTGTHFLAGDLNEVPDGAPVKTLTGKLSDSFLLPAGGPEKSPVHTVTNRRIDYVLTSPGVRVVSSRIVNDPEAAAASDHLPYVVEIEF